MLSKKVADLLNNQVNKELYSAYLYLDFENYYHDKSLEGFANWYHVLHYHLNLCCTSTSNGITDYYKIITSPRME